MIIRWDDQKAMKTSGRALLNCNTARRICRFYWFTSRPLKDTQTRLTRVGIKYGCSASRILFKDKTLPTNILTYGLII